MKAIEHNIPTVLVVFGATGDLVKKKIIPSIYHLYIHHKLPQMFRVVGMSRQEMTDEAFRGFVYKTLEDAIPGIRKKDADAVCRLFVYVQGDFSNTHSFTRLKGTLEHIDALWGLCTNKLFYLAVPPEHFTTIFKHMAAVGLNTPCGGTVGWTRLLIEKPFGVDKKSARSLCALLGKYFKDEQLYLIDHYLAKEIVQAISHFRFSNNLFEKSWNKHSIERIDIRLLEDIGAEGRGAFYDRLGAFRDVGQNHLVQMLSAITMDIAPNMDAATLRNKRAEVIETLRPWTSRDIRQKTFRAQYSGYRAIDGVSKTSQTETYFKLQTELLHDNWRGVPIVFEAGKRVAKAEKIIDVTFKHPAICVACRPDRHIHNRVVFTIEPENRITVHFWTKRPGFEDTLEERTLDFFLYEKKQKTQYVEEYAELILHCLIGDQRGFVSEREIMAEWNFVDPVIRAWNKNAVPLEKYVAGSSSLAKSAAHIGQRTEPVEMKKEFGIIGLGKMGANMARRMMDQGWKVVGYNLSPKSTNELAEEGMTAAYSLKELSERLVGPKVVWLMVPASAAATAGKPAGKPVDEVLFGKDGLAKLLKRGDIVIDGGNSFYKDTVLRAKKLEKFGIKFLDCGTSGGPDGARRGACLMIGGKKKVFQEIEMLFHDVAGEDAYQFFDGHGAGHFVKMIHNGIEYGMMQAIAEGFAIMKKTTFNLDLTRVADVYNHGSVIESRLVQWLRQAFETYGEDLAAISGSVEQSGEGKWTVKTAHEMGITDKVIHEALRVRYDSSKNPNYTGQIVSAMRGQFGGHPVLKK